MLKKKYYCDYAEGRCKLKKCDHYDSCVRAEKINYDAWIDAFEKDKSEELNRLMRGGV